MRRLVLTENLLKVLSVLKILNWESRERNDWIFEVSPLIILIMLCLSIVSEPCCHLVRFTPMFQKFECIEILIKVKSRLCGTKN